MCYVRLFGALCCLRTGTTSCGSLGGLDEACVLIKNGYILANAAFLSLIAYFRLEIRRCCGIPHYRSLASIHDTSFDFEVVPVNRQH